MKRHPRAVLYIIIYIAALWLTGCRREEAPALEPVVADKVNPYTPVKDQGRNNTCWIYAMLAAMETTHLSQGDSVNLSPYYVERAMLLDAARHTYLTHGQAQPSPRGIAGRALRLIGEYGLMPYDAYSRGAKANSTVLMREMAALAQVNARGRRGLNACLSHATAVAEAALGHPSTHVYMLGAEYTPQEFGRSMCAPDEYEALTSFTHHPFYTAFPLEVPDNTCHDTFRNVPLDTLITAIVSAVRRGQGVCWEGDTSEPGFSFRRGRAVLRRGERVTQEARQKAFECFATTDDHCMAIVGLGHDRKGRRFFLMKNSWGTANPHGGLMWMSEDYARLKTVAVYLPREK